MLNDSLQSVSPFTVCNEMDSCLKKRIKLHMKPMCNVILSKGDYYIYQAESLLREPGLSCKIKEHPKIDRFFVTKTLKRFAQKISVVVKYATIPELEKALLSIYSRDNLKKMQKERKR